jgi:hypothetical protein
MHKGLDQNRIKEGTAAARAFHWKARLLFVRNNGTAPDSPCGPSIPSKRKSRALPGFRTCFHKCASPTFQRQFRCALFSSS